MQPSAENLAVAVRIRPWIHSDNAGEREPAVRKSKGQSSVTATGGEAPMSFDAVFPPEAEQSHVYQALAAPLIERVISGENACLMAFGQTGSGKSYTMLGAAGGRRSGDGSAGCIPQAAGALFRRIARMEQDASAIGAVLSFQIRASFLEIHRGSVFDLLADGREGGAASSGLKLREDGGSGIVYAAGAAEVAVSSVLQLLGVVERGAAARSTAATDMNAHSSRSHAVLVLAVERRWATPSLTATGGGAQSNGGGFSGGGGGGVRSRVARFALVDLAGSECMGKSFASRGGRTDAAGVATNLGLSALGRVVRARAAAAGNRGGGNSDGGNGDGAGGSGSVHVPYRDDPLTWLLRPYLSGGASAAIVACVSPAPSDAAETLATLKFAKTARTVRMAPAVAADAEVVDEDPMRGDVQVRARESAQAPRRRPLARRIALPLFFP